MDDDDVRTQQLLAAGHSLAQCQAVMDDELEVEIGDPDARVAVARGRLADVAPPPPEAEIAAFDRVEQERSVELAAGGGNERRVPLKLREAEAGAQRGDHSADQVSQDVLGVIELDGGEVARCTPRCRRSGARSVRPAAWHWARLIVGRLARKMRRMTTPPVETRTVTAADGRTLMVEVGGDPEGLAILAYNGTPNSRHLYGPWLEDAVEHGIRLMSYDRPGYGGSTPQPGRTVADCAADVRSIAEALGVERLAVWGTSGGGPHALACAALLPDLVVAVTALCSIAPYGAAGLDYFSGMGRDNVDDIKLYLATQTRRE